jgi:protein SCO1/2
MNKKFKFRVGIAVAVGLLLSFYFVAVNLSHGKLKIPGRYRVDSIKSITQDGITRYDTVYHRVAPLILTNQLGKTVNLNSDAAGKILVVDFIFTSCNSICPRMSAGMKMLQKSFIKKNPEIVQFVSISVDPSRDSVPVLREYANRYQADHDRWWFLTGDLDQIVHYARNELGLSLSDGDVKGEMIHSSKLVLIDTARNIRGYYDGLDTIALRQIADDIVILTMEKNKK